ncbi:MAG TPA: MFS transporter [Pseudonocardia sp.]|nr:MFS transporter [Pseudonocardia sp.]
MHAHPTRPATPADPAPATAAPPSGTPAERAGTGLLAAALGLCVALVVGLVSAINLAIPALAADPLAPTATELLWVVDGYVVVFACLLVPAGALADRLGRKGTLLVGLAIFAGGTAVCAAAPGVAVLLAGRVIAGVGAAAVLPTTLALLVGAAAPGQRPRQVAVWASMTGLAAVLGNVGGGAAVQAGSWRALFAAVVPLALLALAAVAKVAPRPPRRRRPLAVTAGLLFTVGCLALLYGLVSAPESGWTGVRTVGGFAVAAVALAGWVGRELRGRAALLDPRLFRVPALRAGALGMAVVFAGMFALMYVNGQYLQYAKGYSVLGAGVRLLPMAAALWLAPRATAPVARRWGPRVAVGLGLGLLATGLFGASFAGAATPYAWYALCATVVAAGCGTATPPLSDGVLASVPADRAGLGSGLQSVARELGSAFGVAVVGSVLNARFAAALPAGLRGPGAPSTVAAARLRTADPAALHAVVTGFSQAMSAGLRTVAAAVLVVAVLVLHWLPGRPRSPRAGGRP